MSPRGSSVGSSVCEYRSRDGNNGGWLSGWDRKYWRDGYWDGNKWRIRRLGANENLWARGARRSITSARSLIIRAFTLGFGRRSRLMFGRNIL